MKNKNGSAVKEREVQIIELAKYLTKNLADDNRVRMSHINPSGEVILEGFVREPVEVTDENVELIGRVKNPWLIEQKNGKVYVDVANMQLEDLGANMQAKVLIKANQILDNLDGLVEDKGPMGAKMLENIARNIHNIWRAEHAFTSAEESANVKYDQLSEYDKKKNMNIVLAGIAAQKGMIMKQIRGNEIDEEKETYDLAVRLHEDWKRSYREGLIADEKDIETPRWKKSQNKDLDKAFFDSLDLNDLPSHIRVNDNGEIEVDIAHMGADNPLSPSWIKENYDAASKILRDLKGVVSYMGANSTDFIKAADEVHEAWLDRRVDDKLVQRAENGDCSPTEGNDWIEGCTPRFKDLDPKEQAKDLDQLFMAGMSGFMEERDKQDPLSKVRGEALDTLRKEMEQSA